ncbi:hypothetical protein Ccrd_023018 [Cynara cardunculus var. scolymus]|uniref:Uncharacterized protein n=1 Tax=Cynara cardunculus var. scolymus TaxID=59895 RepID=A0A118JZ99_CYNCS|nr:hypothetical protein Ccrd_023018 [Cynara cardunculus var. scolymus]
MDNNPSFSLSLFLPISREGSGHENASAGIKQKVRTPEDERENAPRGTSSSPEAIDISDDEQTESDDISEDVDDSSNGDSDDQVDDNDDSSYGDLGDQDDDNDNDVDLIP